MSTQKILGQEYDPEAKDQFIITEGRYYSFMYFIPLPNQLSKFGQGGDINGMVWRKDSNPNEWFLQFRFRQYRDEAAFGSKDEKTWYFMVLDAQTEEQARADVEKILRVTCDGELVANFGVQGPLKVHFFEIHGTNATFFDVVHKNPPFWMHQQTVAAE